MSFTDQESATGHRSFDADPDLNNMTKKSLCTGRFMTMHKRRKKRLLTRSLGQEMALLDDMLPGQVKVCLNFQSLVLCPGTMNLPRSETMGGNRTWDFRDGATTITGLQVTRTDGCKKSEYSKNEYCTKNEYIIIKFHRVDGNRPNWHCYSK